MKKIAEILFVTFCAILALGILVLLSPVWVLALLWMAITKKTPRGL